ncbi:DUF2894 domain-containing protein [Hydrogenophaga sp.]|uniref:DUF2894 domain-containing protein n=1 Tax=Hydrogenophaga sp. TaxID=1904254 RepID=UPI00271B928D|nr:DUF2894 domain-containing protein [Hydrogenophaga sp.]MDO9436842.1 DUF2894 domain-containing protein [Hydrogenophaga sp.]
MADAKTVRAHYREALASRLQGAPPAVQRVLQQKLRQLDDTSRQAEPAVAIPAEPPRRRAAVVPRKPVSPLAQLNQHIADGVQPPGAARPELRSAQAFRETWSRICAENDVHQAVQRAPENAGPLNSHMLVLRTLGMMRTLSPDYLRRFMAHADTLLWLDQAGNRLKAPAAKAKVASRQKK